MRFRGGAFDVLFDDAAGRWGGFGDPEGSLEIGEGAGDVTDAVVSSEERISLSN